MRESIRWGACLRVKIEEFRITTGLHTVAIDTNRQVALQYHTLLAGIVGSGLELLMQ